MGPVRVVLEALVLVGMVGCVRGQLGSDLLPCNGSQTIVHLFEWLWTDIADECENFLAPAGFCAVQVSPPQEHRLKDNHPWDQRYEPISYLLDSRSGTETEFRDMVKRCNEVGVRILVDAVFNNLAEQNTSGIGSAGSYYDAASYNFPSFDDPYFFSDSCPNPTGIVESFENADEARTCRLEGKLDLATHKEPVQLIIAFYLNELISYGVAGFRIDAASNISPEDLEEILSQVVDLEAADFPLGTRPFFYHYVIAPTSAILPEDYYHLGFVTEQQYGQQVAKGIDDFTLLESLYNPSIGMIPSERAVIFVDSHVSQRDVFIPSGELLTYKTPREYQMAVAFMMADNYGLVRLMSGYDFLDNKQGPPADGNNTLPVGTNPDGLCENGWVCEHRWSPIANMVEFRNAVAETNRTNFQVLTSGCVILTRGDVGFFAMAPAGVMNEVVNTGLPEGEYCEIVGNCTEMLSVAADGTATIVINDPDVPFVAYCAGCGLDALTTINTAKTTYATTLATEDFTSDFSTTLVTGELTTDSYTDEFTSDATITSDHFSTDFTSEGVSASDTLTTDYATSDFTSDVVTTDMPATDSKTSDYTTDITTDMPTTDSMTSDYTTDLTTDMPTTDSMTSDYTTDLTTDMPTTDSMTSDYTTDITTDMPTTDSMTSDYTTDITTDMPTTDFMTSDYTTDLTTDMISTTESPYKRTVIFIKKHVYDDQYVFMRGGINEETHPECGPPAEMDSCALPFTLQSLGTTPNYAKYDAWRDGDDHLDWFGAETGQGYYQGTPASGSPMAWTTNTPGVDGYQELNVYGEDYWMMDFIMDCSQLEEENGWFEVKGWLEFAGVYTGWELDISQGMCTGTVGGTAPSYSTNHKGFCGHINVFIWNEGDCIVDSFPDTGTGSTTTVSPGSTEVPSIQRTVLFIEQHTVTGQDVFLLGGSDDIRSCSGSDAASDPCSLPITTLSLGTTTHYDGYDDWRVGDNYLDWHGAEVGQGTHNGLPAFGSPAAWTSNSPSSPGYQVLNTFGEAYWMLDFELDCSLTKDGWFFVKGWLSGDAGQFSGLEDNVAQETCTGTAGGSPPYLSTSHMAKCGHINVFHYDRGDCIINAFTNVI